MISTNHNLSGLPDPNLDPQFYEGVAFKRLLAWVIDFVIFVCLFLVVLAFSLGLLLVFNVIGIALINFLYRVFMLKSVSATVGMMVCGIEIRNGRGDKLDTSESIWHTGLYMACAIVVPIQLISMAMMVSGTRGQGVHDVLLGTTAINRPMDHH